MKTVTPKGPSRASEATPAAHSAYQERSALQDDYEEVVRAQVQRRLLLIQKIKEKCAEQPS